MRLIRCHQRAFEKGSFIHSPPIAYIFNSSCLETGGQAEGKGERDGAIDIRVTGKEVGE